MKLFLLVIVAAVLLGLILGGRFSKLEKVDLHWWGLALVGLGLQFIPVPEGAGGVDLVVRTGLLALSYALLIIFAASNLRIVGMWLLLVGITLNAIVIVANGGMPVSTHTLRSSGQEDVLAILQVQQADKHHLLTDADEVTILADVIAIPQPVGQAISVGDIFIYAGLMWAIVAAMRGRTPSPNSTVWEPYRGRHRPGEASQHQPDLGFLPAARTSGTG